MSANVLKMNRATMLAVVVLLVSIGGFSASAFAQGCCGGGQPRPGCPSCASMHRGSTCCSEPMPHGGQLAWATPLFFEVVYWPKEIRVYVYGPWPKPRAARGITGEVALQTYEDKRTTRVELHYVAAPAGEQDYLSATADLTAAQEKNLMATVKLKNLPGSNPSTAELSPTVVVSQPTPKSTPKVTLAKPAKSDQPGIARQRVLPDTGAKGGPPHPNH